MRKSMMIAVAMGTALAACGDDVVYVGGVPAPPDLLAASHYGGSVTLTWELGAGWDDDAFRVYSKRTTDAAFFFVAEVTSCTNGFCRYEDLNVVENQTYQYYVAAVDPGSGEEALSATVQVFVPAFAPPPVPDAPYVIALDDANYFTWGTGSRSAGDFSHYKIYQDDAGTSYFLGETDSEGFVDLLAGNGITYDYFVTAVDTDGFESQGSVSASGTPRPDFHGELLYAYEDSAEASGFRFQDDEATYPVLDGDDVARDFRLESNGSQWFLRPDSPNARVYPTGYVTSALKCGLGADAGCTDVSVAPSTNFTSYQTAPIEVFPGTTYVLALNEGGDLYYGAVRVEFIGFDAGKAIMIFDWAFQLQANNPALSPSGS